MNTIWEGTHAQSGIFVVTFGLTIAEPICVMIAQTLLLVKKTIVDHGLKAPQNEARLPTKMSKALQTL